MKPTKSVVGSLLVAAGLLAGCGQAGTSLTAATTSPSPARTATQPVAPETNPASTIAPTTEAPVVVDTPSPQVTTSSAPSPVETQAPPPVETQAPQPVAPAPAYVPPQPVNTYTNVDGNVVPGPQAAASQPAGATAKCNDGTWSFSAHHQGSCSSHGGVAYFI